MFKHVVTTESELRELIGSPSERAIKKDVAVLDAHCRDFIARSPFLLLATASAGGRCDVSPKGDVPGFGGLRRAGLGRAHGRTPVRATTRKPLLTAKKTTT